MNIFDKLSRIGVVLAGAGALIMLALSSAAVAFVAMLLLLGAVLEALEWLGYAA